ncbi:[acyl-carrier-protein] S-malonyltransferase [Streptomyces hoynatensis]|uniref:Malonyl CoA-acyl carrier protein transacylase n=1 Tax=Streptomyces hoynatensis TaxID=1141874 RepID=A0A3A9ZGD0_9ACTN|nr:[acyl-carrier-protein] S-malonyltransferase [Streptomyces hoynatensis]
MRVLGFPGQGAQKKGMGEDLFALFPQLTARAEEVLGYSVEQLCVEDPDGALRRTEFAQPALYVVEALAYLRHCSLRPGEADRLLGHSVGEYAALFAAGVFDFVTGLRLVKRRGELMSRATAGTMAAVLGLEPPGVRELLSRAGLTGLDLALHNAPGQVALAGPEPEVERLLAVTAEEGVRCVRLNVSGPFHSRYLRQAAERYAGFLRTVTFGSPRVPVIANATARPHRPGRIARDLVAQLTSPVRWVDSINGLRAQGELDFTELGPGTTLTGMLRRILQAPAGPASSAPGTGETGHAAPPATASATAPSADAFPQHLVGDRSES